MNHEAKTKELIRPMPATWWLKRWAYTKFMIRELSSVFIAAYCVFLMVLLYRAGDAQSFAGFYESLKSPLSVVLHLVALFFAIFNSVTAMHAAPRMTVIFRGDEKVPDHVIVGGFYAIWMVLSVVLLIIALVA